MTNVEALRRLDALTRRLRRECPWDREQDERTIVPHTVEEAYELAAAANAGDDAKLLDELGDVLFQVHFLSLLLEERGAGSLADVAEHCRQKLIRRHPHVFGEVEAETAGQVLRNWDADQGDRAGPRAGHLRRGAGEPARAAVRAQGAAPRGHQRLRLRPRALRGRRGRAGGAAARPRDRDEAFHEVGDVLFAAVNLARKLKVDPELALRGAADRFRGRVQGAADLAAADGAIGRISGPKTSSRTTRGLA